ncbi:amidohydrolase family protein [Tengunoibacter tsumagoiensis]|uniref:Amidohydrolase-related domain-containing protein n=1 Tax=Tengunoibacter tsumagoiensis TaxID=2014871 RepID=A0A402A987_9CHLR|nr:amidohydrolase family protein [Tengunoibacter tsumagoiensis]GCE15737.1 hypothetical protein KTT_55960 [Tengunoibacter tsumagoiensis]
MDVANYPFPPHLTTPLAITHVSVIPMDSERVLPDQTVVIEDDRIIAIGPSNTIAIEPSSITIDGTGKYLMPGLNDMHVHYWYPAEAALFLSQGVTVVRNMAGGPYHLALQQRLQRKELPGPLLFTTSPLIEGGPPIHSAWRSITNTDEAVRAVYMYAERGYQQIKIYNQLQPDVVRAIGHTAQEVGMRMVGHCPNAMTFEEASDAGQSCFEHLTGIWRGHLKAGYGQKPGQSNLDITVLRMVNEQIDEDAIRRLGSTFAQNQIWNCPTLITYHYMLDSEETCCADAGVQSCLRYVPQQALTSWKALDPSRYQASSTFDPWITALHRRNETFVHLVSLLHQEGAPLLIGTDTSVRYVIQGISVHQELELFVAAGLSPFEALRCGTTEAARFLGQGDEWGTITVGKRANMILLRENPLENIQAARQVEAVCVNGFYLAHKDLDAMLAHLAQVTPASPPQSLPEVRLANITDTGSLEAQGTWREEYMNNETGYLVYRQSQLPDGDWLLEEHHVFEYGELFSQGGPQQRKTTLRLAKNGTIRHLTSTNTSWLGTEQTEITWLDTEAYLIHTKAIDGHNTTITLHSPPLLPADTLSFTVFPWLTKHTIDQTERQALSIDETGIHIVLLQGSQETRTTQDTTTRWQIDIDRPDIPVRLITHVTHNGTFLRMEQTGRIHQRTFIAVPTPSI